MKEEKKILRLTVCKKWFDMIVAGTKKEEYREIKAYWEKDSLQIANVVTMLLMNIIVEELFIDLSLMCYS